MQPSRLSEINPHLDTRPPFFSHPVSPSCSALLWPLTTVPQSQCYCKGHLLPVSEGRLASWRPLPAVYPSIHPSIPLPNNRKSHDAHILVPWRALNLIKRDRHPQVWQCSEQGFYRRALATPSASLNVYYVYIPKTVSSSALASSSAMQRCGPNPNPSPSRESKSRCMSNTSGLGNTSSSRLADWFEAMIPSPARMSYYLVNNRPSPLLRLCSS